MQFEKHLRAKIGAAGYVDIKAAVVTEPLFSSSAAVTIGCLPQLPVLVGSHAVRHWQEAAGALDIPLPGSCFWLGWPDGFNLAGCAPAAPGGSRNRETTRTTVGQLSAVHAAAGGGQHPAQLAFWIQLSVKTANKMHCDISTDCMGVLASRDRRESGSCTPQQS